MRRSILCATLRDLRLNKDLGKRICVSDVFIVMLKLKWNWAADMLPESRPRAKTRSRAAYTLVE